MLYSADKIANTVGHYDSYFKKQSIKDNFSMHLINPIDIDKLSIFREDANLLVKKIKALREEHGFSPSQEIIVEICKKEIMRGKAIKRERKSIMTDYPDEFIRKMRLTGLISLRGNGRFLDINKNEKKKIDYILKKYSIYKKYDTERSYFNHLSQIDNKLISFVPKEISETKKERFLHDWVRYYSWDKIKLELLQLTKRNLTKDEILKYLSNPVRLEFLTALTIKSKFPDIKVIPNYPTDDEGLPTSTAGGVGNKGDIECFEKMSGILVEVTMFRGQNTNNDGSMAY